MVKRVIGDLILTGCGLAFLYIFVSILVTGGYIAVEDNPVVLWAEIVMSIIITGIGLVSFIGAMRSQK